MSWVNKPGSIIRIDTVLIFPCFPEPRAGIHTSNHWLLTAQTQEIDVLQVVTSDKDAWDQTGKPSTPPFPIP